MAAVTRREFIKVAGITAFSAAVSGCFKITKTAAASEGAGERPNIILILADDMGYSDIRCYGGDIDTPNIDSLAKGGLRFTQFYNAARCCPTRASLLTGLYPHQTGIGGMMDDRGLPGYRGDLNKNCVTIAEVLKGAGYRTYMAGKWHVTNQTGYWNDNKGKESTHNFPCERGFDRLYGTIIGAGSFFDPISLMSDKTPIKPEGENYYYTDAIGDNTVKFINEHSKDYNDKPFFCYTAFTSPHWPLHALESDIKKYKGRFDKGWDVLRKEKYKRMVDMGIIDSKWPLSPRDGQTPAWESVKNKEWFLRRMEVYAAQIDSMDRNVGKIVDSLKKTGKLDNTLIFFLSDNGGNWEELGPQWKGIYMPEKTRAGEPVLGGNRPELMPGSENTYQTYGRPWGALSNVPFRMYKHWTHEGGISTPLVVHWPEKIKSKGDFRRQMGHIVDIMATCVDVSGAQYPAEYKGSKIYSMEGKSLVPAFDDKPTGQDELFWEHENNKAVRMGKWKLVSKDGGRWELYDMEADRSELNDLSQKNPELVEKMKEMYGPWAKRCFVEPTPKSNKPNQPKKKK